MVLQALMARHLKSLPLDDRLAYLVHLLWHSPYVWGSEHIGGTDCSGSVCFALYLMGYNVRVTANDIYNMMTKDCLPTVAPGCLAFWWTKDKKRIRHVAVFSDGDIIMNASEDGMVDTYRFNPFTRSIKSLDWDKVAQVHNKGIYSWDLDPELKGMYGIFSEEALNG